MLRKAGKGLAFVLGTRWERYFKLDHCWREYDQVVVVEAAHIVLECLAIVQCQEGLSSTLIEV